MKKCFIVFGLLLFCFAGALSYSHMGEKHGEMKATEAKQEYKESSGHHGEMEKHHGETPEHHGMMEVLHESMEELGGHTDKIFHSIIHSNFTDLSESVKAVKKVAEGLEGTKPHKNIENMDRYNELIEELKTGCSDFENAVDGKDPMKVAENFGRVIGVCVECHINFRD